MKKVLLLGVFSLVMFFTTVVTVSAAENEKNGFEGFQSEEELIDYLKDNEVPNNKIEILVEKSKSGIEWDAYKTEKQDLIPASFYEFDLINDDTEERYYRFDDGSFVKVYVGGGQKQEVNNSQSDLTPQGVVSDSFGTMYRNYKVQKSVGTTHAYFYANFYVPRYGASMIYTYENSSGLYNSPYGEGISGFGATGNPEKIMVRDVEYNGNAALFRLKWFTQATVSGSWAGVSGSASVGSTCNLYLALVNHKVYIASELPFQ